MKNTLVMPKAGLTNTEGTVGPWKVPDGTFVQKGDVVLEIETEKATMEVSSPVEGYIHIVEKEGAIVAVGGVMAYLFDSKDELKVLQEPQSHTTAILETVISQEAISVVMPKAGLTNTEGTVRSWKVEEGAEVKNGEVLLEIETEKATMDVNGMGDGFLHILAKEGEVVPVGDAIGMIFPTEEAYQLGKSSQPVQKETKTEEEAVVKTTVSKAIQTNGYVKASPLAKKIAKKEAVDISLIVGTGPNGRVLERDVTKYLANRSKQMVFPQKGEPIVIPMTPIRKAIAKNMFHSLKSMAQTSDSVEIDVTELVNLRKRLVEKEEKLGTRITVNDLLSFAVLRMLKDHPLANATLVDDTIMAYPYVNLSMAVATEHGLTSPVIPKADRLSLVALSKALKDIVIRARAGKLTPSEMGGGTITITNMGIFPVDQFNPIVNPPQSAIIGFGRCVEKPAVYHSQITIRTRMVLNITYDHRVFDGSEVGMIMRDLKDYLEDPELMLIQ